MDAVSIVAIISGGVGVIYTFAKLIYNISKANAKIEQDHEEFIQFKNYVEKTFDKMEKSNCENMSEIQEIGKSVEVLKETNKYLVESSDKQDKKLDKVLELFNTIQIELLKKK